MIPPTIENDNAQPLTVYKGENFIYECRILKPELQNRLVYFIWGKFNGVNKSQNLLNLEILQRGSVLNLTNVTEEDSGEYACYVTNQKDTDYKVFNLSVISRAEITGTLASK